MAGANGSLPKGQDTWYVIATKKDLVVAAL